MKRHYTSEIGPEQENKKVLIKGWTQEVRDLNKVKFIVLRDVKGIIQLVANKDTPKHIFDSISKINKESVLEITGTVKKVAQAPNGIEVIIENLEMIAEAEPNLPIQVVEKGATTALSKRLDNRFLDLHKQKIQAIFKIESEICHAFREYFYQEGYIEIQTPCIISSASEGGTELFPAKYFEQKAYLAQSPQLYKQMTATSMEKVTMITPVWRAEKHNTIRHINEARQMDIELAFSDEFGVMEELGKSVQYIVKKVNENCVKELELLDKKLKVPKTKYLTYTETIDLLNKHKMKLDYEDDIPPEAEKKLCELYPDTIIFVHDWPLTIKPFYIMPKTLEPKEKMSRGFDAIYGGIEISSGGQRIHLPKILEGRLKEKKLDPKDFKAYIDSFRFGAPPHAGWSIGLERFTMTLLGLDNIRESTLFPRDRDRLIP